MARRPLTADLRGVKDDGRRWWAVAGNTYGAPWFYPAPSGRQAVAQHRRECIDADVSQGYSRAESTAAVRARDLTYQGPYTTREAFVLDAGWTLANAVCDAYRNITTALGPISDLADCEPMLTADRVERTLDQIARNYQDTVEVAS